ncbi:MAG TPA: dTMP kinase [Longimicrobiaceae bacterium]|jgi:dTMP kinase|nr:dTMP kinase [Longimicrobiaceae bacterium]
MPERGLFLAFEGVEGSGKTTQVRLLAEHLRARGADVVVAREPGSTPLGERVRETVLMDVDLDVPARGELFLMLAARAAFVDQVVRPGIAAGRIVIADRFELSTLAYQGAGRGLPPEEVHACNLVATGGLEPDATLLLDLDPAEGARRQQVEGKQPDRLEREDPGFHQRVAVGYRELASRVEGIVRVDAMALPGEVHRRVLAALAARFPGTFGEGGV